MQRFHSAIRSIKLNKPKTLLLCTVLFVATFLRLYNFPNTLIFQADQARDAILVSRIFTQHRLVFIGPVTSVGNMYLGPLYYYFMLPFLMISYPSPLGPAYGIALLSILTVFLFYKLGKSLVGEMAGIISAILAAVSTTLIYFSRFSWNPNPVPLVSLLMIYCTYLAWKKHANYWLGVAICFSVLLQLHYITLIMLAGAGVFWLASLVSIIQRKKKEKSSAELMMFFKVTLLSILVVGIFFSPLVLFDLKHDGVNLKAFQSIFTSDKILTDRPQSGVRDFVYGIFRESHGRTIEVLFTLFFGKLTQIQNLLLLFTGAYVCYFFKFKNKIQNWEGQFVVIVFLVTSILGISAYKRSIFDHYLLFIVPMSLLFFGSALANLEKYWFGKILIVVFLACFGWYNFHHFPLTSQGWTLSKVEGITNEISPQLKPKEKYDIVLISESGDFYGLNYRYFLNTTSIPPIEFDRTEPTSTLVIINESQKNSVTETIHAYQIEVFGHANEVIKIPHADGPNIEIWRK